MALEFRSVTKQFESDTGKEPLVAIRDVSARVERGEFVAVVGP